MKQLSENILDIAENSVKAKASLIAIALTEGDGRLEIRITDDGCGMNAETLARVSDPFYTTRTTRKVGLGIPFFREAAEQTGGSFAISSEPGRGTETRAVFDTSSIDCPPLGDVASTLMTLIGGAPAIDFVYTHKKAGEPDITLDTRELRETLGDVPLDTPEVLLWIRDSVREAYLR